MKTEFMIKSMEPVLGPEAVSHIKRGRNVEEEYTYEGGELDEIEICPPPTD